MTDKIIDIYPESDPVVIRVHNIKNNLPAYSEMRIFIDEYNIITIHSKDEKRV